MYQILFGMVFLSTGGLGQVTAQERAVATGGLEIFSGTLYRPPSSVIEGNPWLIDAFQPGYVCWLGEWYQVDRIKYDCYEDRVTVQVEGKQNTMPVHLVLSPELANQFDVQGRLFSGASTLPAARPAPEILQAGYHEIIYQGDSIHCFAKHVKLQEVRGSGGIIVHRFEAKTSWYLFFREEYHRIKSRSQVLALFKEHRNELKALFRQQKISIREASPEQLAAVCSLIESLQSGNVSENE